MLAPILALVLAQAGAPAWLDNSSASSSGVSTARSIDTGTSTATGLSGGGDLSTDRSLSCVAASATSVGCLTTSSQTVAGAKTFSSTVTSSVASGSNAYVANQGGKWCLDSGCTHNFTYDGSSISFSGAAIFIGSGNSGLKTDGVTGYSTGIPLAVSSAVSDGSGRGGFQLYTTNTLSNATAFVASFENPQNAVKFKVMKDGVLKQASSTLVTCASGTEGDIALDAAGGASTGHRTRRCMCTSDGGGTPAYAWQNMVSGTVGTTTTCSD
jgi:hypothetical protein